MWTDSVYGQPGQLLGEYDAAGNAIREYVWPGDTPVAVFTPDPAGGTHPPLVYFIHADHLDAPRIVVDSANALRWRWLGEPFGTTAAETSPAGLAAFALPLRLPGQVFDPESGLHYNYFRDYDPSIGRYAQSDPIGLDGGINTYAYVGGNPLSYYDATGEIRLPNDPSGLPGDWQRDPRHRDPNGERWRHPSGDVLDWHKGRPGMPGWRGKDHWHHNGGNDHLPPGTEVPDPPSNEKSCGDDCKQKIATIVNTTAGAYIIYRCVRMIPSLAPPLWWTISGNIDTP